MSTRIQKLLAEIIKTAQPSPPPPPPPKDTTPSAPAPAPAPAAQQGPTAPPAAPAPPAAAPPAQPPAAPAGGQPAPSGPAKPVAPLQAVMSLNAKKAVKQMQDALQTFASEAFTQHMTISQVTRRPRAVPGGLQPGAASNTFKDFNQFVTTNYLNTSTMHGSQWTDESGESPEEQTAVWDDQVIHWDKVVDTLTRIGRDNRGRVIAKLPDGNWEQKTQNALLNFYAFAEAIVRVTRDFKPDPSLSNQFTKQDLFKLFKLINIKIENLLKLPAAQKEQKATQITPLITKFNKFYMSYVRSIVQNPIYTRMLRSDIDKAPLWTQEGTFNKDPGDLTQYQDLNSRMDTLMLNDITISTPSGFKKVNLPVSYLRNTAYLDKAMIEFGGYQPNRISNNDRINFLKTLLTYINHDIDLRLKAPKDVLRQPNVNIPGTTRPASPWGWANKPTR
jgi:hypothetical protein